MPGFTDHYTVIPTGTLYVKMVIKVDLKMFLGHSLVDELLCRRLINIHRSLRCFLLTQRFNLMAQMQLSGSRYGVKHFLLCHIISHSSYARGINFCLDSN